MSRLLPFLAALLSACAPSTPLPEVPSSPVSTGIKRALGEEADCDVTEQLASIWRERGLSQARPDVKLSRIEIGMSDILSKSPETSPDILSAATCGRVTPWVSSMGRDPAEAATTYDFLIAARSAQQLVAAHAEPSSAALSARQAWMIANHLRHGILMNQMMATAEQDAQLDRELLPRLASLPPEERTRLLVPMVTMAKAPPSIADTLAVEANLAARAEMSGVEFTRVDGKVDECLKSISALADAARTVEALPVTDRPKAWPASPVPGCEEEHRIVADLYRHDALTLAKLNDAMR